MSVDTLMQVAQFLHRPVTMFLPGVYANEGLYVALQVLERRPDLLPRVIDLLKVSLQGEAERNSERKTRFALCR